MCGKRPTGFYCLSWLLTAVNKNLFETPKAGLFTSNNANKKDVCAVLFGKTPQKNGTAAHMDSQMARSVCTVWQREVEVS